MSNGREFEPVPVVWLDREDLLYCRADLRKQIDGLDDGDIACLADRLGDALQETYWLALEILLAEHFKDESPK